MLTTQNHTYVFNCGEGMQRICQSKGRVPRCSDIFLTRVCWDVAGGLPGTTMSKRRDLFRLFVDDGRVDGVEDYGSWAEEFSAFSGYFSELSVSVRLERGGS